MPKRAGDDGEESRKAVKAAADTNPLKNGDESLDDEMGEFEDPYGDDFESEDEVMEVGDEDEDEEDQMGTIAEEEEEEEKEKEKESSKKSTGPRIYIPHLSAPLGPDEIMEPDLTTYDMLHTITVDWPCLSFDIIPDNLGEKRQGYPKTEYLITGTQAQRAKDNEITVMKLSSLAKTLVKDDDEDDDEDQEDEGYDADPVLEKKSLPTTSTTNRIRMDPLASRTGQYLAASMAESGDVYIWDTTQHVQSFDVPGTVISKQKNRPMHTIRNHGNVEGYAVDWSPLSPKGGLLTGDVSGRIYRTIRSESGWVTEKQPFAVPEALNQSIEDLQWSQSQDTVFASCGADGFIRIWDTRHKQNIPSISVRASKTDVNVISWNARAPNLLASGADDGRWGVWDLRSFGQSGEPANFVASFDFHKRAITSIEFSPHEESIVAVASEDSTVTLWDLSVEADDEEIAAQRREADGQLEGIPSQLLFLHWQRHAKEVHWHKQVPGGLVSTGSDGFSLWKTISV